MMRKLIKLCILVIIAFALNCGPSGPREMARIAQSVNVVMVKRNSVKRTVKLLGTVYGEQQATAMSKIAGRVTQIAKSEGSSVNEGDPIAYVVNDIPGMDYKPGPVVSPITGIVGKVYVEVGQAVAPTLPIATVSSYSSKVKVKASISDHDLGFVKIKAKAAVSVSAYPDIIFEGSVTQFSPVLDPMTRAATVEVTVPNRNKKLLPGMACSVSLILEQKQDVISIPQAALFTDGFSRVVVIDGNKVHFKDIEIGLIGDEWVEVISGLNEGDKVVTIGKERVQEGEEVKPIEVSSQ
jgi:multidrug efflux pump subunit AcrA (membrane-fusion protein)